MAMGALRLSIHILIIYIVNILDYKDQYLMLKPTSLFMFNSVVKYQFKVNWTGTLVDGI